MRTVVWIRFISYNGSTHKIDADNSELKSIQMLHVTRVV